MPWVYDPHSGGNKIPPKIKQEVCDQVEYYERTRQWYPKISLKLRFRNQFCYVDTIQEGDARYFPLCRLRYFDKDRWSLALFTYGNEQYEPCMFFDGEMEGTIESALKICEPFIT